LRFLSSLFMIKLWSDLENDWDLGLIPSFF